MLVYGEHLRTCWEWYGKQSCCLTVADLQILLAELAECPTTGFGQFLGRDPLFDEIMKYQDLDADEKGFLRSISSKSRAADSVQSALTPSRRPATPLVRGRGGVGCARVMLAFGILGRDFGTLKHLQALNDAGGWLTISLIEASAGILALLLAAVALGERVARGLRGRTTSR